MEVVVTTGATRREKLQSKGHHQQTNTQLFLQAGCPSCHPTNSVTALALYHRATRAPTSDTQSQYSDSPIFFWLILNSTQIY